MAKTEKSRERLLYTLDILKEYSDEEHLLSVRDISRKLENYDIETERRSLYRDLAVLQKFGIDKQRKKYFYDDRLFEDVEFIIIMEAIASLKAIPPQKSKQIINKLKKLMGVHKTKVLSEGIVIDNSKKVENGNIYYVLDALQQAIKHKKKVTFQYGTIGKERRLDNGVIKQYILSPYRILLVDEVYYLVGNYDTYDDLSHYRVEKIQGIQVLDHEGIKPLEQTTYKKKELDTIHYIRCNFGMFAGEVSQVTLQCHWEVEEIVRNKFGSDVLIRDKQETSFAVCIQCVIGDAFIRWLISFSDYIKVIEPVTLREEIRKRIQKMAKMQVES